jgi:CBS domain-containing protein
MVSPVPAPGPDTELRRVARVLLDSHLPGLPVVDAGGVVVGFISRSDVLQALVHDPPLDLWT